MDTVFQNAATEISYASPNPKKKSKTADVAADTAPSVSLQNVDDKAQVSQFDPVADVETMKQKLRPLLDLVEEEVQ